MRKPEPLGTEFKNLVDAYTGQMLWLEVMEGKERMHKKEHTKEVGVTAACVMRGVKNTEEFEFADKTYLSSSQPRLFFGDSWFGSVKAACQVHKLGHHGCFVIKTAHSRTPKKFLEDQMKYFPGGTWIVMEGYAEKEGVPLVCIGYKYNAKKVLVFITTKGAGSTQPGEPYLAKFADMYGNVCTREVARPEIISNYYNRSNVVDLHNQARQAELALEKKWVTQNAFFRLYTTLLGIIVIDTWKGIKRISRYSYSITDFADILAKEMLEQASKLQVSTDLINNVIKCSDSNSCHTTVSKITEYTGDKQHTKIVLKGGKQLRCMWCSRVNLIERKTTLMCQECGKGFCRDENNGLSCWSHHVALGGVPKPPKYGTRKRKLNECMECN